ncbi:MAG: cysteine methyltransferase [Pseudonocardiales bacterium]|nr:MAG: cysteine methyltransferase [Pseudonocardiales bacterium]
MALTVARTHTVIESPVGPLTLVATAGILSGIYMHQQRHRPPGDIFGESDESPFTQTVDQLCEYFSGHRAEFSVPIAPIGTPFQRRVWAALREVPYGHTVSYRQLADQIGQPTAARAVGLANGRNPISIIIPCHRVLGSNGQLTGYGGGPERKQQLLDFEHHRA